MKVFGPLNILSMSVKRWKRHTPKQIAQKWRNADVMLTAGQAHLVILRMLEVSVTSYLR